jgi:hypothetical protein
MQELKANTAVDVLIGPFVDDTDGKTAETALTISQADVKLSKNGQALAQKNDATAAAHDSDGYYNCELDATDTNTEGTLVLIVNESGALPVRHEFAVLSEAAWDSKYAAKDSGYMDVNIKHIGNAAGPVVVGGSSGLLQVDVAAYNDGSPGALADSIWDEATSGHTGAGTYGKAVSDILADTDELQGNQSNWLTATGFSTHSAADVWAVATRTLTAGTNLNDPSAASIADAVWNEATADHVNAGSFGKAIVDVLADTDELQGNQGDWATASGFSTHSAADVWAVATRALTDKAGFELSAAGRNSMADTVLSRSVSIVEDTADEHSLCTVVLGMTEWSVSGSTLTIKKTDGSTTFATKTLTTSSDADPITGVD